VAPSLAELLEDPLPKRFRRGTHRSVAPADTLARMRPCAARMGITRIGNITGLDHIGIPVAVALRPNSRSVSVSQGKGLDLSQAMASALMEAAEGFHAEEINGGRRARYHDLAAHAAVVDPLALCGTGRPFDPAAAIGWIEGYDLLRHERCWLPGEIVHTDYTRPFDGYFLAGSNGLASGNHPVEALNAAICEVVERDSLALWQASGIGMQARCLLDLASIDDPECCVLLDRFDAAGLAVRIWSITSDIGVPVFLCQIRDLSAGDPRWLRRFQGAGCHPDPGIALVRALTEAAQTRLTYIAGIRDDLLPGKYQEPGNAEIADALFDALAAQRKPVAFKMSVGIAGDDLRQDLGALLNRLQAVGIDRVVAVDLTRPDLAIPVVRVVIPGLEGDPRHPLYRAGPRARRAAAS
jgi:ribosomal protein S12 methylthiotransferase accessory factor